MIGREYEDGTLTLRGQEIKTRTCKFPHTELKFYPENPRIYSSVYGGKTVPSQSEIEEKLTKMDHVKRLVQSIKANDGLLEPVLVRDGDFVVLEGNSRLAAYRLLGPKDPIKWGELKCTFLPKDIDESLVFALLGEYHIIGRKDWAPYEQAGYLWRRVNHHKISPQKMADEMGMSVREINRLIEVYEFMLSYKVYDVQRWSYYFEYLRCQKIKRQRREHPEMDDVIVDKIERGEIPKAEDVRDKLKLICQVGGRVLKKLLSTPDSFEECYDRALEKGADNTLLNRLNKFRQMIANSDVRVTLKNMPDQLRKKSKYELVKINKRIEVLLEMLDKVG